MALKEEDDKDPNNGGLIYMSVRDTGYGISINDQKKLFKDFSTIKETANLNPNGVGLGLSICKKICKLLNGDIWVESRPGKGSVFTFNVTANVTCEDYEK